MNHDPFAERLEVSNDRLNTLTAATEDARRQLDEYNHFDRSGAEISLADAERTIAETALTIDRVARDMDTATREWEAASVAAKVGLDVFRVFDSDRRAAAKNRVYLSAKILDLRGDAQKADVARDAAVEKADALRRDLNIHDSTDPGSLRDIIDRAGTDSTVEQEHFDKLTAASRAFQTEAGAVARDYDRARTKLAKARSDVAVGERLNDEFTAVRDDPTESGRRRRHEVSKEMDGLSDDWRPWVFLGEAKRRQRTLSADVEKLGAQLADMTARSVFAMDATAIVIDGSNVCYRSGTDQFVGTAALEVLVGILVERFQVTVFFDGSIRRDLHLRNDADVEHRFPRAHVTIAPHRADGPLLDAAANRNVYVISGDKFVEFPQKAAVRDGRTLPGYVGQGRVSVPLLDLNEPVRSRSDA